MLAKLGGRELAGAADAGAGLGVFFELHDMRAAHLAARHRHQVKHERNRELIAVAGCRPDARIFRSPQPVGMLEQIDGGWLETEVPEVGESLLPEVKPHLLPQRYLGASGNRAAGEDVALDQQPLARSKGVQEGSRGHVAVDDIELKGSEVIHQLSPPRWRQSPAIVISPIRIEPTRT